MFGQATPPSGTFTQVAAGETQTCGLRTDGNVACWGVYGSNTPVTSPPYLGSIKMLSVPGDVAFALLMNGLLRCWKYPNPGTPCDQVPISIPSFIQVSCSNLACCGVAANSGGLACWGNPFAQELLNIPSGDFMQASLKIFTACGIRSDGTLACWGENNYHQAEPPTGNFLQVCVGQDHACGIRTDETVACWGDNLFGQATPPAGAFTQVACGDFHNCGLRTNGTLTCWGSNADGKAPALTLNPTSLSNGAIGQAYSQTISAAGGAAPYTFAVAAGNLPPGLALSPGGSLSGSPTALGTYGFTVFATDSNLFSAQLAYSLTVTDQPIFFPSYLPLIVK